MHHARIAFAQELSGVFDQTGKVAYIPGGIGEAVAWALATVGAKVAVSGRDAALAQELQATRPWRSHGRTCGG